MLLVHKYAVYKYLLEYGRKRDRPEEKDTPISSCLRDHKRHENNGKPTRDDNKGLNILNFHVQPILKIIINHLEGTKKIKVHHSEENHNPMRNRRGDHKRYDSDGKTSRDKTHN